MSINCIRTLIEDADISNPNKVALVFGNEKLTYGELFTKVNQIAYYFLNIPNKNTKTYKTNRTINHYKKATYKTS